jgi:voltage-gated potassium channel
MSLLSQLLIGTFMIGVTVIMHAVGLDFIIRHLRRAEVILQRLAGAFWRPVLAAVTVVTVFALHVAQIWLWAFVYLAGGCDPLTGFADALEYSTAIYTTVGSNVALGPACRMLGNVEGGNGFLLFGWTTAFIFEVIAQFYRREAAELED